MSFRRDPAGEEGGLPMASDSWGGGPYFEASAVNMHRGTVPPLWNKGMPPSSPRSDPLQLLPLPSWKEASPSQKQKSSHSGMALPDV